MRIEQRLWNVSKDHSEVVIKVILCHSYLWLGHVPIVLLSLMFVYTNRRELRPFGVKVSIIEPGYFKTGLNDMQYMKNILSNIWKNLHPEIHYNYGENYFKHCKFYIALYLNSSASYQFRIQFIIRHWLSGENVSCHYWHLKSDLLILNVCREGWSV